MARHNSDVSRQYADKSIPELLKILDENFIALRRADPDAGVDMNVVDVEGWPDQFTTFLKDPASEEEIDELEERLAEEIRKAKDRSEGDGDDEEEDDEEAEDKDDAEDDAKDEANKKQPNGTKSPTTNNNTTHPGVENGEKKKSTTHLPEDYKTFLRHSNGFFVTDPDEQTCLFYGTSAIDFNIAVYHDSYLFLFENPCDLDDEAQIPLGAFRGCSVGAGGDEGALVLIEPDCTREILDKFEKAYQAASAEVKKVYEEEARERFGGLEALRGCEGLVVELTDSGADHTLFLGFREYLEERVGDVVGEREKAEREKAEGEKGGVKREGEGEGDRLEGRKRRKVDGDDEEGGDDDDEDGSDDDENDDKEDS